jgi:toxin-antitoxin system PIN domain toxin
MTYFPDVNVWVALIVDEHSNASLARHWADEVTTDWIAVSRVTQMSLLRLLTNAHVLGRDALSGAEAWRFFDELLKRPNIRFVKEPEGLEEIWRTLTSGAVSASSWTDAYLAAFARTTGFTLVTFDRGFSRYRNIPLRILTTQ